MPQVQDGFRQRLGGRANLPPLQRQLRLAEWQFPGDPKVTAEISCGP